jgi:hypothetical protein
LRGSREDIALGQPENHDRVTTDWSRP